MKKSDKINIICIGKKDTFIEFIQSICYSLSDMKYTDISCRYYSHSEAFKHKDSIPMNGDINIVIYSRREFDIDIVPNKALMNILIYTEQKEIPHNIYKRWDRIIVLFPELVLSDKIHLLILGYSSYFAQGTVDNRKKPINVFFFGSINNYRKHILTKNHIYYEKTIYGKERDDLIRTSKVNINICATSLPYYFAPIHALLVICKGEFLLQQRCIGDYDIYKPYIKLFDLQNITDNIRYWILNKDERTDFKNEALCKLRNTLDFNYNFKECVKGLL